ncbi:MAG TPA: asparagine synthase-related protein [Thermoanaerobaculia bacterium]|nr:asparagine synthase-related protein [Thermoanaerobaculia bacterium]
MDEPPTLPQPSAVLMPHSAAAMAAVGGGPPGDRGLDPPVRSAGIAGIVGRPAGERMLAAAALRMRSCERARRRASRWFGPPGLAVGCGFPGSPDSTVAVSDGAVSERGVVHRSGGDSFWGGESDREWLLAERYREEGPALLERLGGAFALAIWEPADRRLLLARDRHGAKPLYWRQWTHGLAFCSTIAPLLAAEPSSPRPDLEAVEQALALGWVPAPRTGFAGVHKLPPGGMLEWVDGRLETGRFWWFGFEPAAADTETTGAGVETPAALDALDALESALRAALRRQLDSARRPGLWLSGGLDSSYLAALAAGISAAPLVTLTARFPGTRLDEGAAARETAQRIGSEHHELVLGVEELASRLDAAIGTNEEPWSASPSAVIAALAERTATAGCDLVLTGDGADELFSGGHQWLHLAALTALRAGVPRAGAAFLATRARSVTARNRWLAIAAPDGHLAELESARRLTRAERERLVRSRFLPAAEGGSAIAAARLPDEILRRCFGAVDRRTALDLVGRMAECLLPESEKQLVHRGLRLTTPYLDDGCVDLIRGMPGKQRLRLGRQKWLLSSLARRRLPRSAISRPKIGLRYPPALIAQLEDRLRETCLDLRLFRSDSLRRWLSKDAGPRDPRVLVTVYTVGRWWQMNFS